MPKTLRFFYFISFQFLFSYAFLEGLTSLLEGSHALRHEQREHRERRCSLCLYRNLISKTFRRNTLPLQFSFGALCGQPSIDLISVLL